ncbi:hypothetical protein MAPG_01023 [Magnaporthiopsis poae ATCC 64411]|uniref:Tyrosyl-DNA phosphodiesterase 1 n=1 Tax=Magnaporthiopsis poae (strain ATCC 64411 / 73-15) TaxID=644358 RepID=A0A0C4DML3_MAGP6|nr:hypothetical protein MAPG_01023 [Magnaporthiopsis poae ATCC 64411]
MSIRSPSLADLYLRLRRRFPPPKPQDFVKHVQSNPSSLGQFFLERRREGPHVVLRCKIQRSLIARHLRPAMEPFLKRARPESGSSTPRSLGRAVSPPRKKGRRASPAAEAPRLEPGPRLRLGVVSRDGANAVEYSTPVSSGSNTDAGTAEQEVLPSSARLESSSATPVETPAVVDFSSPFRLTHIRDLGPEDNVDAVQLKDVIGDPLISECWDFNYLHDINFLLGNFDEDVRHMVKVNVVHGFWKKDDPRRIDLQRDAAQHKNVNLHAAFMPEMFGTHHSKMLILLRHDDTAQVVIHTANMIRKDWTNMTQSIWLSPRLPLLKGGVDATKETPAPTRIDYEKLPEGSGDKFKADLLSYLRAYDKRRTICKPLVQELQRHDFSSIRGTLIASVPGRHQIHDRSATTWGWAAVRRALESVPLQQQHQGGDDKTKTAPEVVVQISSIATLGPTDTWLRGTLFDAMSKGKGKGKGTAAPLAPKPRFKVVFPTPDEIRVSLDGYASGGSIHTKIQSAQQAKQLLYLKPLFCHWANDSASGKENEDGVPVRDAGRKRAAPHVKTYIRYADGERSLDWALMTSANLSKQAWGEAANAMGEVRIASWEIGVLVWPSLFAENARMSCVFGSDRLPAEEATEAHQGDGPVVGLRIPYNFPVQAYGKDEIPWVATAKYDELDWKGQKWER